MASMAALADIKAAVLQVRASVGVARIRDMAVFRLTGPDVATFLQNRLSNDVLALQPETGHLNAALDRQGHIQGLFSLYRTGDEETGGKAGFLLLLDAREAPDAMAAILKYRILEQVQVEDISSSLAVFRCDGPRAPDCLASLGPQPDLAAMLRTLPAFAYRKLTLADTPVQLIRRALPGEDGYWLLTNASQASSFGESLQQATLTYQGVEMTPEVLEILRLEAGLPRYDVDYTHETLLPETGLERFAVSYSKGCYLGQETIARVRTYGTLPKALTGLIFEPDASLPEPGTPMIHDGREVGTLKSHAVSPMLDRPVALASLGKALRVPGETVRLALGDQSYQATVALPPFYDPRGSQKTGQDYLQEGLARFAEGMDAEAIRLLEKAIALEPERVDAYEALGVILARQDRYPEAIALMEQVLRRDPDHVLAHTNLSVYYMKLGDKEKAEAEKAKATMAAFSRKAREAGLTPADVTARLEAERQRKEQATLEKIDLFIQALRFNPEDPLGNFGLGSAYLDLHRFADAVEPLQKTIQAQPKHSVAYLSLGKALEALQRTEEARSAYRQGIAVAAARGDLMPLQEMQTRLAGLPEP